MIAISLAVSVQTQPRGCYSAPLRKEFVSLHLVFFGSWRVATAVVVGVSGNMTQATNKVLKGGHLQAPFMIP